MIIGQPLVVVQGPVDSRSGYGDSARDFVHHLINLNKYDIKIITMGWGGTPNGVLKGDSQKDKLIMDRIFKGTQLPKQPDIFIQVAIPNEFQPIGKFNIGYTAGIETTLVSPQWIEGCNKMNLVLVTSEHSKKVFESSEYTIKDQQTQQDIGKLKVTVPMEVMPNCVDTEIFKKVMPDAIPDTINKALDNVTENFAFLFVGHWLQGDFGQDRKNVGMLIKIFLETFKKEKKPPALILKTSGATFSLMNRDEIIKKIEKIKATVESDKSLPPIYLIHGNLTNEEMNGLYNHPKVKAHVSFTKGEGFGLPLLQATLSMKPVIASGWSGQLDFLDKDNSILVGGTLEEVHPSVVWENVILKESQWFTVDNNSAANALMVVFRNYNNFLPNAKKLGRQNRKRFSYPTMQKRVSEIFDKYLPKIQVISTANLPQLRKIVPNV